jgi:hypothetical protein
MRLIQVTLGSAATPIVAKGVQPANSLPFQTLIIQNNAAHAIHVGDSTVSSGKGIQLTTGGSLTIQLGLEYSSDLYEFFLFGTAADVIDVLMID